MESSFQVVEINMDFICHHMKYDYRQNSVVNELYKSLPNL